MKYKKFIYSGLVSLLLNLNCGQAEMPTPEVYSPKYNIGVVVNQYNPDLNLLDRKYEATTQCLGYDEEKSYDKADTFVVKIAGKDDYSGHGFACPNSNSPTGRCNGEYVPETKTIRVNETLGAFSHELVHHLTKNYKDCFADNPQQDCQNIPSWYCGDNLRVE